MTAYYNETGDCCSTLPPMHLYLIENTINTTVYVGITSRKLSQRWAEHLYDFRAGKDTPLYRAMRKHGADKFSIRKVASAETWESLCKLESLFIKIRPRSQRYNISLGGEGSPGHPVSPETRQKIREKHLGKKLSVEHRAKLSAAKMGKKMPPRTPEHSAKISAGLVAAHARRKSA